MRTRTIFGILLVLIALVTFSPALVAVGSQQVAEAFDCQVDLNRAISCVIGGKPPVGFCCSGCGQWPRSS